MRTLDTSQALVPLPGQESFVRRRFWDKLKRTLGRVPLADRFLAAYYAAIDGRTPLHARATLFAALAYFILPADAVPDVIAGLGFTDDVAVLLMAVKSLSGHVTAEHVARARRYLEKHSPAG
jgi:uncharacterized membrane protein YkvA (DUF1232 family)